MRFHTIISALSFALLLLVAGCAEDPNPVGIGLLPGDDFLHLDTTAVTATRSFSQPAIPATSVSRRVLVGATNGIECWGILRFSFLPDSIRYMPIVSAQLNLRTDYHFGDSLAPFSLAVHQILQNWGSDSLTIDSLKAPGFYSTTVSGSGNFGSVGDTATITIPIDTTMIRSWGTISDTTISNFGVVLRPTNSRVVKGFISFASADPSLRPQLLLRFLETNGKIDTLLVSLGIHRFVTTGLNPTWPSDSSHIYVMNGAAYRGYVEFDVGNLPPHAAVHKATLELTLDSRQSQFNIFTSDSAYAIFIGDDGTPLTYINVVGEPVQIGSARIYRFPVGSFVQRWIRGALQRRIAITGYTELSTLDLFSFYGAIADRALKPKLTIVYSLIQ